MSLAVAARTTSLAWHFLYESSSLTLFTSKKKPPAHPCARKLPNDLEGARKLPNDLEGAAVAAMKNK